MIKDINDVYRYLDKNIGSEYDREEMMQIAHTVFMASEGYLKLIVSELGTLKWEWDDKNDCVVINLIR